MNKKFTYLLIIICIFLPGRGQAVPGLTAPSQGEDILKKLIQEHAEQQHENQQTVYNSEINRLIINKQFDEAEEKILAELQENPTKPIKEDLNFKYGLLRFQQGRYKEARFILNKCTDNRMVEAAYLKGRCDIYLQDLTKKDIFSMVTVKPRDIPDPVNPVHLNIPQTVRILIYKTSIKFLDIPRHTVLLLDRKAYKLTRGKSLKFAAAQNQVKISYYGTFSQVKLRIPPNQYVIFKNKRFSGDMRVRSKGNKLYFIIEVDLEDYIKGVVPAEIPTTWPMECLKTQAVAARTFTVNQMLKKRTSLYDLTSMYHSQEYGGADKQHRRTSQAVDATSHLITCYHDQPIVAYFHAHSGGYTETAANVWSNDLPYIVSVKDEFAVKGTWQSTIREKEIRDKLRNKGYRIGHIQAISAAERSLSNRIIVFAIKHSRGTLRIKGNTFRMLLGSQRILKSTLIEDIIASNNAFTFIGRGFGHGVGLPQWSAKVMADKGYTFEQILKKYYRGVNLRKIVY